MKTCSEFRRFEDENEKVRMYSTYLKCSLLGEFGNLTHLKLFYIF